MKGPSYRHELKYYINAGDYVLLSERLKRTMERDAHTDENAEYFIRSLYFDDLDDSALREKLSGVDDRDKIRIRAYNFRDDFIRLERKHKANGFILKEDIGLTRAEYESIMRRDYRFLLSRREPFAREMFREFATRALQPRVLVDYTREAYVFPVERVRVTFDKDVRTGLRSTDLFNPDVITYPVLENRAMILEVKFNQYLPTFIRTLLQIASPERSAASKYCLCRKYEF